jgi:hypothetical protein
VAARDAGNAVPPPVTLPLAIDAVLGLIDDPARWPATVKADRACKALRKALIAAHDVLKTDVPAPKAGRPVEAASEEASP